MERKLERQRIQAIADIKTMPREDVKESYLNELRHTSYRVAQRRGGLRWVVERVTR